MNANRTRKQKGQNLAELAIVLPLLILLLLVILDLGRITYSYSALHNAVREGARYGVIHYTDTSDIEDYARTYAVGLNQDELTITPLYSSANETITVTGLYEFKAASPILRLILNTGSFTLHAETRMITEE
ncbi:MAG TPA: TadE/TadG family type IV pilus assembly protein [Anaerolineales bacterium]|nr:TadE/TadG family type IV pilus assembly protein [Anaerolineales bacterium]